MDEVEKKERRKKKWFYYSFSIVAVVFLQFQVSRFWFHRKHLDQLSPEELKLRQEQLAHIGIHKSPEKKVEAAAKPTESLSIPLEAKHDPTPTPSPTPLPEFTYTPHQARSRIFAYFIRGKSRIKVDLFYDIYPDRVTQFISRFLGCSELKGRMTFKLNLKWPSNQQPKDTSGGYTGFLFEDDLGKNKGRDLILINPATANSVKNFNLIGGVFSYGDIQDAQSLNEEIIFKRSDVLFTYIENEDTNEQYELFKKVVDILKAGCNR